MPRKRESIYESIISKAATITPMFAKAIVDIALEKQGLSPATVTPLRMLSIIKNEIEPRLSKFTGTPVSLLAHGGGFIMAGADEALIYMSPIIRKMAGLPADFSIRDPRAFLTLMVNELIMPACRVDSLIVRNVRCAATDRRLRVAIAPVLEDTGEKTAVLSIVHDITLPEALESEALVHEEALDRTRAELEGRNLELKKALAHKMSFMAKMSHEMRTPLHTILGYCELIAKSRREEVSPGVVEDLGEIERSARELLGTINDILDISSFEMMTAETQIEELDLEPLLSGVATDFTYMTRQKNLRLVTEVEKDLPPVCCDRKNLVRVLRNLLSNAVKFTQMGRITLKASAPPGEGVIEISVSDTGVGIPADKLDRIFESFYQVDDSLTRSYGGVGLGLALVRSMTESMGGSVRVESRVDVGSTFTVTLRCGKGGKASAESC